MGNISEIVFVVYHIAYCIIGMEIFKVVNRNVQNIPGISIAQGKS